MANRIFQAGVAFGASAGAYGARTTTALGAAETLLVPVGWVLVEPGAHAIVQFTYDAGSTFVTWVAASTVQAIWSDGANVRFLNDGTPANVIYSKILGA